MRKLTPKQEAFAQAIADGHEQSEAYRIAYNVPNSSPTTRAREGHSTAHLPHVAARIAELKAKTAHKRYLTRERKREILAGIADAEGSKRMERIKAIEVDNVMTGDNAPQKVDVFGLSELLGLVRSKSK